ncbi:MAG: hypothetical protein HY360_25820 [Verrucomicrobia bacterium]|nr:hypothetical protein [Verrucomicrobiota bacterium]
MKQKLILENRVHLPLKSQPIRHGVPWPQGVIRPEPPLAAFAEDGAPIPLASRTLNGWPDGSAQWSLLDLALDLGPSATRVITIDTVASDKPAPLPINAVKVSQTGDRLTVENGLTEIVFGSRPGCLVESWRTSNDQSPVISRQSSVVSHQHSTQRVVEDNGVDVFLTDSEGTVFSAARCSTKKVWIEDANPLRVVVRVDGKHEAPDGRTLLDFWLRFTVTANRGDVKLTYHYHNLEKQEPGITLHSMAIQLRTALPASAQRAIVHSCRTRDFRIEPYRLPEDIEIVTSNTPNLETYPETHKGLTGGGLGRVFLRQHELLRDHAPKPWFLRNVVDFKFGNVFSPEWFIWSYLGLVSEVGSLLVLGANMVGLHPKSLAVNGSVVRYSIWPDWAGPMEITQGEGRTLEFFAGPLPPDATDEHLMNRYFSWEFGNIYGHHAIRPPLKISMDADHVRRCGVFAIEKLPAFEPKQHFAFERKVRNVWTPDEASPAHGHWHYGDLFLNYETGANNEEMVGLVWFQEYLRTGRSECLDRGLSQAQHIADVDIVAYSNDPYQNGGMCAHGPRHNHCAAYPSHMWFTELLFAYALTGDAEFKKAAVRVCDCLTFWVNDKTGFGHICADGRESGQPLINLAWTYQFAPEPRFLDAMWKIVRGSFMAKVEKYGQLIYPKPREDLPLIMDASYGEWAAWEGLFWVWELTKDEKLKQFILSQLEWRLTEERMGTHGFFRSTDYNVAAYAYYMTGDPQWLQCVARPFRAVFRSANWSIGWIKAMYFIKLAFEHGIVRDDDVLLP